MTSAYEAAVCCLCLSLTKQRQQKNKTPTSVKQNLGRCGHRTINIVLKTALCGPIWEELPLQKSIGTLRSNRFSVLLVFV